MDNPCNTHTDFNCLANALLLLKLEGTGTYIPLPSLQVAYGPHTSLNDAKTFLADAFGAISNVPRGYTFCVIENNKPVEYWFTQDGDWSTIERKNSGSGGSSDTSNVLFRAAEGYIQVSYDSGNSWNNLVALSALKGNPGAPGSDGRDVDLNNLQLKFQVQTVEDPDTHETVVKQSLWISRTGTNGTWSKVGDIIGGSGGSGGGGTPGIATYVDGNKYWTLDGEWLLDDDNQMVRANGLDGQDGRDGDGYATQYKAIIFKRQGHSDEDRPDAPTGGTYDNPTPVAEGWSDGVPATDALGNTDAILWMSTRWFSTNEAINDANTWSTPQRATDTADMDFEYSNAPLETIPNGPGPNKNINIYNPTTNPNGWYDADLYPALLVNANWMAMRVAKNGYWGAWKVFKIRGEAGEAAVVPVVSFMSTAFRRSDNYTKTTVGGKEICTLDPSENPTGGSYSDPNPTNVDAHGNRLWSDGVPQGKEKLWVTTRIFYSGDTITSWRTPVPVGDTANMDFEWCDAETPLYPHPTRTSPDDINPGREPDDTKENGGWYDEPDENADPIWMAMRPCEGNRYTSSDWQIMRVKGERGDDGTSFVPKGQLFGIYNTANGVAQAKNYYDAHASSMGTMKYAIVGTGLTGLYEFSAAYPNGRDLTSSLNVSDAYSNAGGDGMYIDNPGDLKEHIFIWDGDNFIDFGNIKGDPGMPVYFHIKYSNDGGHSFTFSGEVQDGETPGEWIGTRVDNNPRDSMNPDDYKPWKKWQGEDGFGYEYVFQLNNNPVAPSVPTEYPSYEKDGRTVTYQDDDYVPEGWTDDPGSPTKSKKFCWVIYRRKEHNVWQPFRGSSADSTRAALFSKWSSDGRGIEGVTEMYAVASFSTLDGMSEQQIADFKATFVDNVPAFQPDLGKVYLWNYEIIHYDDGTDQETDMEMIGQSIQGRGIESIEEFYYACDFGDPTDPHLENYLPQWGRNPASDWKLKPMNVDKNNPYLWNFERVNWTDGTITWTRPVIIAYYVYTDIEYLLTIFKKVEGDSNTAYLGGLIGVVDKDQNNNDRVRAVLNATDAGKSSEHGKLFIASGMNGVQNINSSTFKVYEDGHTEMHDALIQCFLQQYYKSQQNVEKDVYLMNLPGYERTIEIDRNKCGNYVMLAWQNLVVSGRFTLNLVSSNVNPMYPGKIVFTNSMYITDNGSVYYNAYNNPSFISVNLLLPDGTLRKSAKIVLRNGWIEIGKVRSLSVNNEEVVPSLVDFQNVYMLYSWGGNVTFSYDTSFTPIVNSNSVITGYEQTTENEINRFIDASASVARVHMQNKVVFINTDGTEDALYIVMPFFYYIPDYQSTGMLGETDYAEPITWLFEIETLHREVKFKYEPISANTPDADIPDLPDLKVAYGNTVTDLVIPNTHESGATPGKILFKITYYPGEGSVYGNWVVEKVTQVASID